MKNSRLIARTVACASIALALAFALAAPNLTAQAAPNAAITLEPPTGAELHAHLFDAQGAKLPEAPANFRRLGQATVGLQADVHLLSLRFSETQKVTGLKTTADFRVEKGGTCAEGNVYQAGTTCTVLVRFTPQGAGNRFGRLSVTTNLSPTPMAFGLGGYGYSPIVSIIPAQISTLAGTYPSNVGLLNGAQYLTVDGSDTLSVADTGNGLLRQKDSSGNFVTLASGYTGLSGVAVDTFGEVYFDVPSKGLMYEIYDYGPVVQTSGSGSDVCAASAPCNLNAEALSLPGAISTDGYNRLFFADAHRGAAFSQVQPSPSSLIFLYDPFAYQTNPSSPMAVDNADNIYTLWSNGSLCAIMQQTLYNAENSNVSFNKIAGGHTCGFAGDGGLAGSAEIGAVVGQFAFDTAGNLYFTDTNNQRVRRIDNSTGVIRTIAGTGVAGYAGDGAGATSATLSAPTGVGVDSTGSVYVISNTAAVGTAQVIRKIGPNGYINAGSQLKGTTGTAKMLTISNTGNSAMTLTGYSIFGSGSGDFSVSPTSTTCLLTPGSILPAGQSCFIGITFTPTASGARSATLRLATNTIAGFNDTTLIGTGTLPIPVIAITSPAPGASFASGTAVNFSVSVTATPVPTGTVQFKVDGAAYGAPVALSVTGTASTSVTGLTQTTHTLSASYSGSTSYAAVNSATISIGVTAAAPKAGTRISLSPLASTGSCTSGHFMATVNSTSNVLPTGTVTLLDGKVSLTSATLINGKATIAVSLVGTGQHHLSAYYSGDSQHLPATSAALTQPGSGSGTCRPQPISPLNQARLDLNSQQ